MKVLHVIPGIAARYGGPSQAIRFMCKAQSAQPSVSVVLATTDADGEGGQLAQNQIPDDFPVQVFPRTFSERWKYSRDLSAWLHAHVREFDVVHIHAIWTHSSHAAARAAQRTRIPYIIRPAGMLSEYSLGHRSWIKRLSWLLSERSTVAGAAAFHATTEAEAEDIRSVWPSANIYVISNGVDESAFTVPVNRNTLRDSLFAGRPERPVLLFLSRLHPKKGVVDLLLPALASMSPRPLLVLAGGADDHDPGYSSLVKHTIALLGLQEDVRLWGGIAGPERWGLFDAADIFVLPSHSENFGIVVAEAMARSCPVVITDRVQIYDHVRLAEAGVVVPADVEALAAAIEHLAVDDSARQYMGLRGSQYAQRHFSWSAVAGEIQTMYDGVLQMSFLNPHPTEIVVTQRHFTTKGRH